MVAKERTVRRAELHRRTAGGSFTAAPELRRRLLHPGGRSAAGPPGGGSGDLVEQQPVPKRAAQRGDR